MAMAWAIGKAFARDIGARRRARENRIVDRLMSEPDFAEKWRNDATFRKKLLGYSVVQERILADPKVRKELLDDPRIQKKIETTLVQAPSAEYAPRSPRDSNRTGRVEFTLHEGTGFLITRPANISPYPGGTGTSRTRTT